MNKTFLIVIIGLLVLSCNSDRKKITSKISSPVKIDSVPQLNYKQMLEEYDTLVSYISQISPAIYFNKEVRGIDFNKHAKQLRKQINSKTTQAEYLNIVKRTINVAQDNHTSIVWPHLAEIIKKYWIPQGIKVHGYDSLAVKYSTKYDDYFRKVFSSKLDLELVYTNGEYYNLLPFSYNGKDYPAKMKLLNCNGENVHKLVPKMVELVSALKWDRIRNKTYFENFYKSPFIYKNDSLKLNFLDKSNTSYILKIAKQDTVRLLAEKKNKFTYNNDSTVVTHYYEKEHLFYAKLPQMAEQLGDSLVDRVKSITSKNSIKTIVLDIRGNGGGSDLTYIKFLKKLVKKPLELNLKLGRNFNDFIKNYYEINEDTISKKGRYSFKIDGVANLTTTRQYYISYPDYNYVTPDSSQFNFSGKIYILQDRFIYSSSSNLSNLAYRSEQLVSIGETPNLLGGLQTNPIALCLPYSKILIRIEPQIDYTDAKTKADIWQNNVEYPINYPIDYLYERTTTEKNIFGKDYIYKNDPMFKKVLELEN